MRRRTVVVTGVSGETGLGILNGLRQLDPCPRIVGVDYSADSAGFQNSDVSVQVPGIFEPDYLESLKAIVREYKADALFLGIDGEIEIVAPVRPEFEAMGCYVSVSETPLVAACSDKLATARFLEASGLDFPKTVVVKGDVDDALKAFGVPVIVKPRRGNGSKDVELVRTAERLIEMWPDLDKSFCLQEYIDGPEYTVSVLFDRTSGVRDYLIMKRELVGGRTMQSHVESHNGISAFVKAFGAVVSNALGAINLQLRVAEDGRVLVFEVNPRFSGSTGMRIAAGYNEPARLFQHLVEGTAIAPVNVRPCSIYRHFTELVVHPFEGAEPIQDLEAIVWDCGDTLLRLSPQRESICLDALHQMGLFFELGDVEIAYRIVDFAVKQKSSELNSKADRRAFIRSYNALIARALGITSHEEEFDETMVGLFRERRSWQPVDGAAEFLRKASERAPLYVVANWDNGLNDLLANVGLRDYFQGVFDSQTLGVEKPNPGVFRGFEAATGVDLSRTAYVGNEYNADVNGSRGVGMTPVLLDWMSFYSPQVDCRYASNWKGLGIHLGVE